MEVVSEEPPARVAPSSTTESPTVAEGPAQVIDRITFTAKFNQVGNKDSMAIGLSLVLAETMANAIKVEISGGQELSPVYLVHGTETATPYMLNDGTTVNVVLTYTGKGVAAMEVSGAIEGARSKLARGVRSATSAVQSAVSTGPSKLRFLPSVAIMALGAASTLCSFAMEGMKALGSGTQYSIAALGVLTVFIGGWSVIERIRFNQHVR